MFHTISSALLESLCSIGYSLETALADIIDNSIAAKSTHISVRFLWNKGSPWVAVVDNGGGMSPPELKAAMRFGSKNPREARGSTDLGRFGLGMKTASISQCRHLTVVSKKEKGMSACEWNLVKMRKKGVSEWGAEAVAHKSLQTQNDLSALIAARLEKEDSGTIVFWEHLDASLADPTEKTGEARFSDQMDSARKHLELVFHRFLAPDPGKKKVVIDFNATSLVPFDPFGSSNPARQELPSEKIPHRNQVVLVQPYVLPHPSKAESVPAYKDLAGEDGYLHNQGFYIYRNKRLIIKATWFRLIPKDELNKLIRVRVDLTNTHDTLWQVDVKKSQANPPEAIRKKLRQIINKISGAGRRVFTHRAAAVQSRGLNPVWKREIVDGRIHYRVNEEHPLMQSLLTNLAKPLAERLRACFALVNSSFPYDSYYADAANDQVEFDTAPPSEETIRQVGFQLVQALRSCGCEEDGLRASLETTEFFRCTPDLIEQILNMKDDLNG